MKGQNIGGKKITSISYQSSSSSNTPGGKWRTKPYSTENESTNYREKDLFTAYLLQYI